MSKKQKILSIIALNLFIFIISLTMLLFSMSNNQESSKADLEIQTLKQLNVDHQNHINEMSDSIFKKTEAIITLKLIIGVQECLINSQDSLIEENRIEPEIEKDTIDT